MVRLDISQPLNEQRWKHAFAETHVGRAIRMKLLYEVGDWLEEHGHDGHLLRYETPGDYVYEIEFDDNRLAILFKLTWL